MDKKEQSWQRNRLLSALSRSTRGSLLDRAITESLSLKTVLYAECETPRFAYFPLSGVASVVAITSEGQSSEVGFIGCEGVVGAYHLLGPAKVSTRCFVQIEGDVMRVPFADLKGSYSDSSEFRDRLHEFIQADSLCVSQMAGCNQMHELKARLARWLLMADDRHKSDSLGVTHDILAEMVAASRTTITAIAASLKDANLISYTRGNVTILDRVGLESVACDCYGISKTLFSELYAR